MSESGRDIGKQKQIHYTYPALYEEFTIELVAAFLSSEYVFVCYIIFSWSYYRHPLAQCGPKSCTL